jgi:hypothetical protein
MHVRTRGHGTGQKRRRVAFYGCTSYWKRGHAVCGNRLEAPMDAIDRAVLNEIAKQVPSPDIIGEMIDRAVAAATARNPETELDRLRRELETVDAEIGRYVQAIGAGGDVPELVAALKARRTRRLRGRSIQFEPAEENGVIGYRFRGERRSANYLRAL